jgi:putative PIN family toxin of toxin-antitoxin system
VRVVLDTNVLIAAFIARGTCHDLLEYCIHEHELVASAFILDEIRKALVKKFHFSGQEAAETVALLNTRMTLVAPEPLAAPVCRDPDDDTILGTALAGACGCIVTGDKDLLVLKHYRGIDIISPDRFWRHEARSK